MTTNSIIAILVAGAGVGAILYMRSKPTSELVVDGRIQPPAPALPQLTLDKGLAPAEQHAILTALVVEKNPANLTSFAEALEGSFPLAASLLKGKSSLLGGT